MAKYIQDMTLGEVSQMVQSYLEQSEKATVVFVKTVGIGGDSFDVNTREEDGREYQLLMVEATLDGANYGIGIEWSPELGGVFGHWKAPEKWRVPKIDQPKTNGEVTSEWCRMKARMYQLIAEQALQHEHKARRKFNEIQLDIANLQQDMTMFKIEHPEKQIWPLKYD